MLTVSNTANNLFGSRGRFEPGVALEIPEVLPEVVDRVGQNSIQPVEVRPARGACHRLEDDRMSNRTAGCNRRRSAEHILLECEMGARAVRVAQVAVQATTEVSLIQDDHVVEELAADDAITRSTKGFRQGERGAVRTSAMSLPPTRRRNSPP